MVKDIDYNNLSNEKRGRQAIRIRVGIATGLVVIGEKAGKQRDQDEQIFGEAPILASRLQQITEPGTVAVSETTRRLTGNAFKFRKLRKPRLKGYRETISAWLLVCQRSYQSRFHGSPNRAAAPMVGRCHELAILADHFALAAKGVPGIIHLVGEAGTGKSRLIHEFDKTLNRQEVYRIRINCSPCDHRTPLYPVISELNRLLHPGRIHDRVHSGLFEGTILQSDRARMLLARQERRKNPLTMLYNLLSAATPESDTLIQTGRDGMHGQVMSLMAGMLFLLASHHPVMLVVEDIQWSDPVTLDFLSFMERNLAGHRLFTVLTSRRRYRMSLRQSSYLTRLHLACLNRQQSTILIRSLLGSEPLPTGFENTLYRKCGGVPLYLEAYCQQFLNRSHEPGCSFCNSRIAPVPAPLQDAINARLDMLGQARKLVQLISVLGSYFTHPTITTLAAFNGIDADQSLDKLLRRGVIKVVADKPETSYVCLEPLLLDAACQSLLRETRRRYHQQVADLGITVDHSIRESPSPRKGTRRGKHEFAP